MDHAHIEKKKTNVAHIGHERFDKLTQMAIDLSGESRRQITGSAFLKFIIDNYADEAKELKLKQYAREPEITKE